MYVIVVGVVGLTSWAVLSSCRAPLAYVADPLFCGLVVMLLWSYFACGVEPGAALASKGGMKVWLHVRPLLPSTGPRTTAQLRKRPRELVRSPVAERVAADWSRPREVGWRRPDPCSLPSPCAALRAVDGTGKIPVQAPQWQLGLRCREGPPELGPCRAAGP